MRFTTPQTAARNQPACPLLKKVVRCAGQIAAPIGAGSFFMGEARAEKAAGKYEKYRNTQLAAAAPELKVPKLNPQRGRSGKQQCTGAAAFAAAPHSERAWLKP